MAKGSGTWFSEKKALVSSLRTMVETLPEISGGRIESHYFF